MTADAKLLLATAGFALMLGVLWWRLVRVILGWRRPLTPPSR